MQITDVIHTTLSNANMEQTEKCIPISHPHLHQDTHTDIEIITASLPQRVTPY